MKKKISISKIVIISLIIIILAEFGYMMFAKYGANHSVVVGKIADTDAKVYINDIKIPSYGHNDKVYIAIEDLAPFGADTIESELKNQTVVFETVNKVETIPDNLSHIKAGKKLRKPVYLVYINGSCVENFYSEGYNLICADDMKLFPNISLNIVDKTYKIHVVNASNTSNAIEGSQKAENQQNLPIADSQNPTSSPSANNASAAADVTHSQNSKIIVLDPGHGKSSGSMTKEEKEASGWTYNSSKGQWGEWRHWKTGTTWQDCEANGCNGRVTPNGACWYPMGNGDRDTEPDINLQNCLSAKKYLEQMGYTVRLTRSTNNENPSITQRIKYCYPSMDISSEPDASAFICVHSNASGGKGTAYIQLEGPYDQKGISPTYAQDGNLLGQTINDEIVNSTSLSRHGGGSIGGEPELIAFCKSPVTCGYMEIGFFDNANDLSILKSESDGIGKAIATGIDKYMKNH